MSFWYLQFSQKKNEKIQLYYYGTSNRIVFGFFFVRIEDTKDISKLTDLWFEFYIISVKLNGKFLSTTLENLNFTFLQNIFYPIVLTGFGFPLWHMKWTALKTRKKGLPYLWGCSYSQCLLFQTQILYLCMQNTDSHICWS